MIERTREGEKKMNNGVELWSENMVYTEGSLLAE